MTDKKEMSKKDMEDTKGGMPTAVEYAVSKTDGFRTLAPLKDIDEAPGTTNIAEAVCKGK